MSYFAREPCPTNHLSNVPLFNFLEERPFLLVSQNRASHTSVEHHPTDHLLNAPLVNFLKKKEAHIKINKNSESYILDESLGRKTIC